jgi:hypothetical protein
VSYFCDSRAEEGREFRPTTDFFPGELRERELFTVDDADWTRIPAVAEAGLEKVPIPGGRVFDVALIRRFRRTRK